MAGFVLSPVVPVSQEDKSSGTYIVLFDALHIPPHLLLSHNGKLYSLSASGRQSGSPLSKLELFIDRKSVPAIFIEWKLPVTCSANDFENLLKKTFGAYPRLEAGKNSCLSPIRDTAALLYGEEMQKAKFIFELLPLLNEQNAIGTSFASHIALSGNTFTLQTYSEDELETAIRNSEPAKQNIQR